MPVVLRSVSIDTGDARWTDNTARVTDTGNRAWSIANTATSGWLTYLGTTAAPGQRWTADIFLACPTGPSVNLRPRIIALSATNTELASWTGPTILVGAASRFLTIVTDFLPAATTQLRVNIEIGRAHV